MSEFQRVSALRHWVIGSLVSDTGSEFLFGYDPDQGLMWLERYGHEYSSSDALWKQAEAFIAQSQGQTGPQGHYGLDGLTGREPVSVSAGAPPKTVTRTPVQVHQSVAGDGWDDPYPMEGDPRIVGDMGSSGKDVPDEDIAAQAAQFLMEGGFDDSGEQ